IETTVVHRGTTSLTLRHVVRRVADDALIAEAEIVFVCVDRLGRATPLPEEIARVMGPRTSGSHQPIRVTVGAAELGVEVRGDGPEALVSRLLPKLLAPETQSEVAEQVREMARRWSVPGLVGALQALRDRPDSTETLRQIRVPTLVLAGSEDQISPPAGARAMAALIPNAQFHVVPAAGHLAPLEQPLATTRVIADFLETLR